MEESWKSHTNLTVVDNDVIIKGLAVKVGDW